MSNELELIGTNPCAEIPIPGSGRYRVVPVIDPRELQAFLDTVDNTTRIVSIVQSVFGLFVVTEKV